jgi:hypothetical protein
MVRLNYCLLKLFNKKIFGGTFLSVILIVLLSGCSSDNTAGRIVESLEENDYFTAGKIYDNQLGESNDKDALNETVGNEVLKFINKGYKELQADSTNEEQFYHLLQKIDEIGIYHLALNETVRNYKVEIEEEDGNLEDLSYVEEIYEEDTYQEDLSYVEEIYEEDTYQEDTYQEDISYEEEYVDEEYYEEEVETSSNPYSYTTIDHDCSDFKTQEDAQLFYEANGGPDSDPHDLDRDNDGMACDWN